MEDDRYLKERIFGLANSTDEKREKFVQSLDLPFTEILQGYQQQVTAEEGKWWAGIMSSYQSDYVPQMLAARDSHRAKIEEARREMGASGPNLSKRPLSEHEVRLWEEYEETKFRVFEEYQEKTRELDESLSSTRQDAWLTVIFPYLDPELQD